MKTQIVESPIIFLSIIKWFFLASCVGGIVGGSTTLFHKTLVWAIALTQRIPYYFWFLPIALPISSVLINYLAPEAEGYGAPTLKNLVWSQTAVQVNDRAEHANACRPFLLRTPTERMENFVARPYNNPHILVGSQQFGRLTAVLRPFG